MKAPLLLTGLLLTIAASAQNLGSDSISISGVEDEERFISTTILEDSATARYRTREILFSSSDTLVTPNPSPESIALYRYLKDLFGKKILSGQMWSPWGINEIDYVMEVTGKMSAVAGFDYINEPQNAGENQKAIEYWQNGGISTMMWHWGAPGVGEGYENSKATIDIDQCFVKGTPEYEDFWADLERIGDWLQKLEDAQVPVLWRPFHELDGGWFWWSKEGPEKFKLLWTTMFDYLVHDRGLNNLIWVLCYTGNPDGDWFPGADYVDIAGADTYDNSIDSHLNMYNAVLDAIGDQHYPIAFHETGNPPNAEECIIDGAMWSWWMVWHTDWLEAIDVDYLKAQYSSHLVVTHDELPDIMAVYGWDQDCEPSAITASVRIDEGEWMASNKIGLGTGVQASLRVETEDEGIWSWSGLGVPSRLTSTEEQTVSLDKLNTITASFQNVCGATSTQTFHIIEHEEVPPLSVISHSGPFSIYPIPTAGFLNIDMDTLVSQHPIQVNIFDLNGRLFLSATTSQNKFSLDVSRLNTGIYQITLSNGVYLGAQKFIKR